MSKGWYKESHRHSLASRGIKTGTKQTRTYVHNDELYFEGETPLTAKEVYEEHIEGRAYNYDPTSAKQLRKEFPGLNQRQAEYLVAMIQKENEEDFVPQGSLALSNHGGVTIQISEYGDGIR